MQILRRWIALVLLPTFLNCGCGLIICLYIPIQHPEVPLALNACFLWVGAVILTIIFWGSYDFVLVIRASEEVIGKLASFDNRRDSGISGLQRQRFLKRAKACRPLEVPIGTFGEFSLEVPVIWWDEILNQLLFLLSF